MAFGSVNVPGRLTADQIMMPDGVTTVSASLSQKVPILQTVPMITLAASNMIEGMVQNGSSIILWRIGNLVCTRIRIGPADTWMGEATYAFLPEGYRPPATISFPMVDIVGRLLYATITTAGELNIKGYSTNSNWASTILAYFTDFQ